MAYLKFNNDKIGKKEAEKLIEICPFGAIAYDDNGNLDATSACKSCKLCVKKGPKGCVEFIEEDNSQIVNKDEWNGIVVFAEHEGANISPVVFELLNKANELASKINHPVYALWIGESLDGCDELLYYGADKVYAYTDAGLRYFSIFKYTDVFEDFIKKIKPCSILVGATNLGRSLGPRIAARFRTGMTADCTRLEMRENTDLVQIRPAFGGNIMAKIITTKTRPQFCTVREKVFSAMDKKEKAEGSIEELEIGKILDKNASRTTKILDVIKKEKAANIADSDILVVVGRGLKKESDKEIFQKLAEKLGGMLASSRALVEIGWMPATTQIGLSGKTVKPKLAITFGVSGAVQFAAGMNSCEYIVAVNTDKSAPIFDIAHVGICADMYEIVQNMLEQLDNNS